MSEYTSPFLMPYEEPYGEQISTHREWYLARERYSKTGDAHAYEMMLSHVTSNTPPDRPAKQPVQRSYTRELWDDNIAFRVACLAVVVWALIMSCFLICALK